MLSKILDSLPTGTRLVAVSKTKPVAQIMEMYEQGHKIFGENRVQELVEKAAQLPEDIEWHFIGHLQTNKIKYIAGLVQMIHSVDRLKVLKAINKEAQKNDRVIDCLLQFHIATEDTKFGLNWAEAVALLESPAYQKMEHIRITGVMGMATFTDNQEQIRKEFSHLKTIFDRLKAAYFTGNNQFCELSMGMSGDYHIAIEEGSTLVRIGSLLFGSRQ